MELLTLLEFFKEHIVKHIGIGIYLALLILLYHDRKYFKKWDFLIDRITSGDIEGFKTQLKEIHTKIDKILENTGDVTQLNLINRLNEIIGDIQTLLENMKSLEKNLNRYSKDSLLQIKDLSKEMELALSNLKNLTLNSKDDYQRIIEMTKEINDKIMRLSFLLEPLHNQGGFK